jgi:hypothetical protein
MRESRTYGSVRGALSNERPYRDPFSARTHCCICSRPLVALRSYAEYDAQRPLLQVKADTLLRRGDRRF